MNDLFSLYLASSNRGDIDVLQDCANKIRKQIVNESSDVNKQIARLQDDLSFVSLLLLVLIKKDVDSGVFSTDEFLDSIKEADLLDGKKDGGFDIQLLRETLGIAYHERKSKFPLIKKSKKKSKMKLSERNRINAQDKVPDKVPAVKDYLQNG